ncbi:MAG TPA: thiamine phosphate synthase [Pyrinomonadaceae bacterium]|nr:thiamine phosphate synthase [Pyrinomonadaceae bacterium]
MPTPLAPPITCLITPGATTSSTTPADREFDDLVALVARASQAGVSVVQIREKGLTPRVLYELAARCAEAARAGGTLLLVNDRADVASAAGCHGVHLATNSLEAAIVRRAFGPDFCVGVSTHTFDEARAARDGGADFALFGPVFDTPSKRAFGPPRGTAALGEVARALKSFPVVALGGVTEENAGAVFAEGAAGVAAIRLFSGAADLAGVVRRVRAAAG